MRENAKQEMPVEDQFYDYPDRPVPADKRRTQLNIAVVTTGMAVAMSTLYTGSALAEVMSYKDGVISILAGCVILLVIATLTGNIGADHGVSTSMLARHPFGRKGSNIVGLILAISMLGWFSYQCGYFGETISLLLPGHLLTSPVAATIWGGIFMMSTAIVGYKGMTYLSMAAAPLLLGMCLYCGVMAVAQTGMQTIMSQNPEHPAGIGIGITIVVGGWITGAVLQPDISRYARNRMHNTRGVLMAIIVFAAANWGGFVIAKATRSSSIMEGLQLLGMGTIGLLIVVLGQWTSNDNNLYSAVLAIINVKPGINKHIVSAVCGVVFTLLAVTGIQNHFVGFLSLLGTFLPPIGTVLVADYNLGRKKKEYHFEGTEIFEDYKPLAFISIILGGGIAYVIPWGSTAINSMIVTFIIYVAGDKIMALASSDEGAENEA